MHTPKFPFAECKVFSTYMLRGLGFFFALYKWQKTKKPPESRKRQTGRKNGLAKVGKPAD